MDRLTVEDLAPRGQRVFVRVDFNVPLAGGKVADDARIRASLPTIEWLLGRGARVILASHLGRPKGTANPKYSVRPCAERLAELLGRPVAFATDCVGEAAERAVAGLEDGQALVLENLRFHAGEENNDEDFARALARLAPLYVDDAFGAAHRAHASIEAITRFVTRAVAGFLLAREVERLGRAIERPERPFVLVMGGAKVSDKIEILEGLLPRIDELLIGGAMAYTLLRAEGLATGRSLVEEDKVDVAAKLLSGAKARGVRMVLPVDHVVAPDLASGSQAALADATAMPADRMALDIGPRTVAAFASRIAGARTIVWNGPLGAFEHPPFERGTVAVAAAIAGSGAYSVVGGGDSIAALKAAGVEDRIGHVSTGGGAALEFLAGRTLPGVAALARRP